MVDIPAPGGSDDGTLRSVLHHPHSKGPAAAPGTRLAAIHHRLVAFGFRRDAAAGMVGTLVLGHFCVHVLHSSRLASSAVEGENPVAHMRPCTRRWTLVSARSAGVFIAQSLDAERRRIVAGVQPSHVGGFIEPCARGRSTCAGGSSGWCSAATGQPLVAQRPSD